MAGFEMCAACQAEYDDPLDRRFHAQPNACAACGPRAALVDPSGAPAEVPHGADAIAAAVAMLTGGAVLAVKGIGGYHLACRAADEDAVAALRARKHREDKPFALMAPSLDGAFALVELTEDERALLNGPERPVVIARRRRGASVAPSVAPRSADLGVMLPYSPLHHLLLADAGEALVLTSGNVSDEPIAYRDEEARERLGAIADALLLHDRPIHTRTDDSVVRALDPAVRSSPLLMRRSRGYVPRSVRLPRATSPILACGAELKSTFCVAKGERAWVSHHVGDLKNYETLASFREGVEHFQRLFAVEPEIVAHDLHPDYLSTGYALGREGVEHVGVQHHHAHLAACLAEHGVTERAVGAIYDGSGYGPDGTVWGGEILAGGLAGFERLGLLFPVRLPGGDAAVREPWRMACSWLAALAEEVPPIPRALAPEVDVSEWAAVAEITRTGTASPPTTSAGRLFDAVAAIAGVRARANYEGQAAAELEGIAAVDERGAYPLPMIDPGSHAPLVLDARETISAISSDLDAGTELAIASARFHNALAAATAEAAAAAAERTGTPIVVLSGGVFQNRLLLERTTTLLRDRGLRVLVPEALPPNDGGISYGQAAVAAAIGARPGG